MKTKTVISRRDFFTKSAHALIFGMLLPSMLFAENVTANEDGITRFINIQDPNAYVLQLKKFTDTYRSFTDKSQALREIACVEAQYSIGFTDVQPEDLFVGRYSDPLVCLSIQGHGFGYCINEYGLYQLRDDKSLTAANRDILHDIIVFWKENNSVVKTQQRYTPEMKKLFGNEDWVGSPHIGVPLYRISGTQCDYDKLVRLGIDGLTAEVLAHKKNAVQQSSRYETYQAMERALKLFSDVANNYANILDENRGKIAQSQEMSKVLRNIAHRKPETFREGAQLMFLWAVMSGSINYGRMDEYLGDLYVKDIENGVITEEQAIELLSSLWRLFDARPDVWNARVIVGGRGRRNDVNADRLALTIIETTNRVRDVVPQLTLRFYQGQNEELYQKSLDVIATGNPYPMLYNDDANIPAVMNSFRVPYEEAVHYLPFGCGEYILNHRSLGTPSGLINILQALSVVIHHGVNPITKQPAPSVSMPKYETFEQLYDCYKKTVDMYVEQLAFQEKMEYDTAAESCSFLYAAMLFDDCIKEGKGLVDGVRYLGGTLESYGNTNTADALTAIKKLVYEDKTISYSRMIEAIDANFVGYELEHKLMLEAPKYGNDDMYADNMLIDVNRHICNKTRDMASKVGLHSYLIVIINNSANTTMGEKTAATPDGRLAYTYMANANAATGGADKKGITAYLNSIVRPDISIHAGAVQNLKFSRDMFTKYRPITEALLGVYWQNGGAQCMINCLNRGDLENAMREPEKYANLIVRVGGFSARFVELPKNVQLEILTRTLY